MWGTIGRVGGVLAAVALTSVWAFVDTATSDAPGATDPSTVLEYRSVLDIDEEGTLRAVEVLDVDMPAGRHGIFRYWDVESNDPHARLVPHGISVKVDGEPAETDLSWRDLRRYRVAKVGDEDTTLEPGTHTYEISYVISGVLEPGDDGEVFHWDVLAGGWAMPIEKASIDVRLPAAPTEVVCAPGCTPSLSGSLVHLEASDLSPFSPITVRVDLPDTGAKRQTVPWSMRYDAVLGRSLPNAAIWGGVSILALLVGLMAVRVTRESAPAQPLAYAPPDDVGPVQAAWVLEEKLPDAGGLATLLYLAERGFVGITRDGDRWTVRTLVPEEEWKKIDRGSRELAFRLGLRDPQGEYVMDDDRSQRQLGRAIRRMEEEVLRWSSDQKYIAADNIVRTARWLLIPLGVGAVLVLGFNPWRMSLVGLPFAILFVMLLALLAPGRGRRRTPKGREVWSRAGGFRRALCTPSGEQRFDFAGRKDLYTEYLPWAMAFGCAEQWAAQYRQEFRAEPPPPRGVQVPAELVSAWRASDASLTGPVVASFGVAVAAAISSYAAVEASGGRSGGAHSGGSRSSSSPSTTVSAGSGDGGGGGGSW